MSSGVKRVIRVEEMEKLNATASSINRKWSEAGWGDRGGGQVKAQCDFISRLLEAKGKWEEGG